MRYYGTITGVAYNIKDKNTPIGESQLLNLDSYLLELSNVYDENDNNYGTLLVKASHKRALRLKCFVLPNNKISFDCTEIKDNIILGIRNVCADKAGVGCFRSDLPYSILTRDEFHTRFGTSFGCSYCKYRHKKKDCKKYKVG